ncbi:MAG TPA: GNAT family N-acetyltransferase [Actinomycetota bacterium]|nr:GNAT family N-acetyltransferase [Actinomycetota bacterium]
MTSHDRRAPLPAKSPAEIASPADSIAIAHLNVWAYREFAVDLGPEAWPELVRALTSVGADVDSGAYYVVRSEDGLLGSAAYRPPGSSYAALPDGWASIAVLAVAPPARRRGVAGSLVEACAVRAGHDSAPVLAAVVPGYLESAQAFFTRMGFHREQGLPRRGEQPYWLYRKILGEPGAGTLEEV